LIKILGSVFLIILLSGQRAQCDGKNVACSEKTATDNNALVSGRTVRPWLACWLILSTGSRRLLLEKFLHLFNKALFRLEIKNLDVTSEILEGCRKGFLETNKKTNYITRLSIKHN